MKAKEYSIDGDEILGALNDVLDHVKGKKTLRTTKIKTPAATGPFSPKEVEGFRKKLNVSQAVFAKMLNVPLGTAKSCESGARKPSGAVHRLLQLVKENPKFVYNSGAISLRCIAPKNSGGRIQNTELSLNDLLVMRMPFLVPPASESRKSLTKPIINLCATDSDF